MDGLIPMGDAKRLKTSNESSEASGSSSRAHRPVDPGILANFDFSTVPRPVLVEIIVESLKLLTEEQLQAAIEVCSFTQKCYVRLNEDRNGKQPILPLGWTQKYLRKRLWRTSLLNQSQSTHSIWILKKM
jgi:hypothetical protein